MIEGVKEVAMAMRILYNMVEIRVSAKGWQTETG